MASRLAWFVVSVILICVQEIAGSDYVNVALGKPSRQKDVIFDGHSQRAVDGNRSATYSKSSCTHTDYHTNNWWAVDLLKSYSIHSVAITNRDDLYDRLQNFTIYISDVDPLPLPPSDGSFVGVVCLQYPSILPPDGPHTLDCNSKISGRFVYLWKALHALTICEFEVMVLKEDLSREQSVSVRQGKKTLSPPFYSQTINVLSSVKCVSVCLLATVGARCATFIQLEIAQMTCQCVQTSRWGDDSSLDITEGEGWILMH